MHLILQVICNGAALWLVSRIVPGLSADTPATFFWAALALGFLNVFVRPILRVLTLPINLLTLGLFSVVLNGVMLYLATHLVPGLHLAGIVPAVAAGTIYAVLNWLLHKILD